MTLFLMMIFLLLRLILILLMLIFDFCFDDFLLSFQFFSLSLSSSPPLYLNVVEQSINSLRFSLIVS